MVSATHTIPISLGILIRVVWDCMGRGSHSWGSLKIPTENLAILGGIKQAANIWQFLREFPHKFCALFGVSNMMTPECGKNVWMVSFSTGAQRMFVVSDTKREDHEGVKGLLTQFTFHERNEPFYWVPFTHASHSVWLEDSYLPWWLSTSELEASKKSWEWVNPHEFGYCHSWCHCWCFRTRATFDKQLKLFKQQNLKSPG